MKTPLKTKHDINNALSALLSSTELLVDIWNQDQELAKKLLPQMKKRIDYLMENFDQESSLEIVQQLKEK